MKQYKNLEGIKKIHFFAPHPRSYSLHPFVLKQIGWPRIFYICNHSWTCVILHPPCQLAAGPGRELSLVSHQVRSETRGDRWLSCSALDVDAFFLQTAISTLCIPQLVQILLFFETPSCNMELVFLSPDRASVHLLALLHAWGELFTQVERLASVNVGKPFWFLYHLLVHFRFRERAERVLKSIIFYWLIL